MKCPNCGTTNGKTNKFCRECGSPLEGLLESVQEHLETHDQPAVVCAPDDVALGEELFGVMRLYENGDLEAANERVNKIIECSPASASAHSIRALIYERKADFEEAMGNKEISHGYLQNAVGEYEKIIDLNPNSAADREKLIALRMKLAGNVVARPLAPAPAAVPGLPDKIKTAILKVPAPILASGATLVVLLVLLSVLIPRGDRANSRTASSERMPGVTVTATPSNPVQPVGQTDSQFKVYTYPTPPPAPMRPLVSQEPPRPAQVAEPVSVPPVKLPAIGRELVMVPEPTKEKEPAKPAQPKANVTEDDQPRIKITPSTNDDAGADTSSNEQSGSSLLAKAIELGNQNKYAEAMQTAQQAAQLYQNDLAAGRNTTAAQRGVDTANKYIQRLRSMQ